MIIFYQIIFQKYSGEINSPFRPIFSPQNIAKISYKYCSYSKPPLHFNCRCRLLIMKTVKSGTATTKKLDGADWILKYESKLPDYYLTSAQAKANGWIPKLANLSIACPNKMIFGGEYYNDNGHLPSKEGRIWYEADINYRFGYRNNQRVVYSNDGLIFVTYDHYKTFFEII